MVRFLPLDIKDEMLWAWEEMAINTPKEGCPSCS